MSASTCHPHPHEYVREIEMKPKRMECSVVARIFFWRLFSTKDRVSEKLLEEKNFLKSDTKRINYRNQFHLIKKIAFSVTKTLTNRGIYVSVDIEYCVSSTLVAVVLSSYTKNIPKDIIYIFLFVLSRFIVLQCDDRKSLN